MRRTLASVLLHMLQSLRIGFTSSPTKYVSTYSYAFFYLLHRAHVCVKKKSKAVPLHAMVAGGGRGGIAPTHS
jgi:hypothetical protein